LRTVTFKSVLYGVAFRLSLDPAKNLPANIATALCEYINSRVLKSWGMYPWPEWTHTDERHFAPDFGADTDYAAGAVVWDDATGKYYRAVNAITGGTLTNPAEWEETTAPVTYILLDQAGKRGIGTVEGVYADDPETHCRPRQLNHWITPNGLQVSVAGAAARAGVWVTYQGPTPVFTVTPWSELGRYEIGDRVYLSKTGECYRALIKMNPYETPSGDPSENSTQWEVIPFPACLAEYVKRASHADALREDGNMDKADLIEGTALDFLYDEIKRALGSSRNPNHFTARVR